MFSTFKKFLNFLNERDKKNGLKLIVILALMGLVEMMGIASILPFLAVVGNPDIITENKYIHSVYLFCDLYIYNMNENLFLILLGFFSFIFILTATFLRVFSIYFMNKYIETIRHSISLRLLSKYIYQSYEYFTNRHTSELTKNIMSELDFVVIEVITPVIIMVSYLFVLVGILSLLLWFEPITSSIVTLTLGSLYYVVYFLSRERLLKYGDILVKANANRFKTASDAMNGIKNIKMYDCEELYLNQYSIESLSYSKSKYVFLTLNQTPKHFLEALIFGGIILLIISILSSTPNSNTDITDYLPLLGLYAISAYRIQPCLSAIYSGITHLKYGSSAINNLSNEYESIKIPKKLITENIDSIIPKKTICFHNVSHKYKESENIIKKLNLNIKIGTFVGIVGKSGSGKTTLLDLILGLSLPNEGFISVDDKELNNDNITSWKSCLSYVPQNIYIIDGSFEENIAFGIPVEEINYDRVIECAKQADIHNFIINNFDKGYKEKVGERGSRISGGQNQRIGIARALYRNPDILILDEATSALDTETEEKVLNNIRNIMIDKTIIMVTHKLATIKLCDSIILLEDGKSKFIGSFEEITNIIKHSNIEYIN